MTSTTSSTLKLLIEKGPRKGTTLEFNPRSTVKIGRLVRGNNVSIKDPGISSKHLSIEFNSDSGKWVITDLESSNGTIVNCSQIKSNFPSELKNGDEIKIGELTCIKVEINLIGEEINIRRNPRRQAATKSSRIDLGVKYEVGVEEGINLIRVRDSKTEDVEKGVDNTGRENRRGRGIGQTKKESILEDVNVENDVGLVGIGENLENAKPNKGRRTGTRSSKREGDELLVVLPEVGRTRRGRSAKNVENVIGSSMLEKVSESEASLNGEDTCKEVENVGGLVEDKKKQVGRGRKKKVDAECSETAQDVVLEDSKNKEVLEEEPCEEPNDDSIQHNMVEEINIKVLQMEVSEHACGKVVGEENPCEEPADDTQKNVLEVTENREVMEQATDILDGEENPCEEPADDTRQKMLEERKNREVTEQGRDILDGGENLCEELADDTQQKMLEETTIMEVTEQGRDILDGGENLCEEPADDTQQKMLEETTNREVTEQGRDILDGRENPCEEPRSEAGNESVVMARFEQDTCNTLENDVVLDEEETEESEIDEVSEETDMDKDCREKDQDAANVPDLEKMTLGQWFDYLEVYLPKQIHDVTDEIVADMRKRAKQYDDFMLQQLNNKGKLPVGT